LPLIQELNDRPVPCIYIGDTVTKGEKRVIALLYESVPSEVVGKRPYITKSVKSEVDGIRCIVIDNAVWYTKLDGNGMKNGWKKYELKTWPEDLNIV